MWIDVLSPAHRSFDEHGKLNQRLAEPLEASMQYLVGALGERRTLLANLDAVGRIQIQDPSRFKDFEDSLWGVGGKRAWKHINSI